MTLDFLHSTPRVSIILPTHNGSKWISRSIKSVISQSYADWELLVIDDGSTDETASVVSGFAVQDTRIKYIKNEVNMGIQKTLNKGLNMAIGPYIARIDDDDTWCDNDKLKKQVEFLDSNADHILLGTGVVMVDENGAELFRYLLPETDAEIKSKILGKNYFVHSSVIFRKDKVLEVGGYGEGEDAKHFEDYDLWLRIGHLGKFANLPIYATAYTVRSGSISVKNRLYVFRKLLSHMNKYKKQYRNYYPVLILSYLRYFLYSIYLMIPRKIKLNKVIKLYKKL